MEPEVPSVLDNMLKTRQEKDHLDKIFQQFLDPDNIEHNTQLTDREIKSLMVLAPIAEKWDLELLKLGIMKLFVLRVSSGRGGRKEWVEILKQFVDPMGLENPRGAGGFSRFFRRRDLEGRR